MQLCFSLWGFVFGETIISCFPLQREVCRLLPCSDGDQKGVWSYWYWLPHYLNLFFCFYIYCKDIRPSDTSLCVCGYNLALSLKQMKLLLSLSGVIYLVGKIEYSFWHLWQCIVYFEFVDVLCLCVSIFQMTAVLGHFVSSYFPWQSNLIRNFWFLCRGTWYIVDKDRKHEISCICFELPEIMQSIIISELCSLITNGQLVNLNVLYLAVPGFYILSDKQRMRWCDKDSCCEFHVDKATIHPSSHIWCVWHASTSTSSFWLYDCCNFAQGNNRRGDMTILPTACMSA